MMYKEIVLSAFAKAKSETPANTKTQWADHLADSLWDQYKYQISRRTLLNYYNHYNCTTQDESISPKPRTIESLCKYLHYPSYAAFVVHHSSLTNETQYDSQSATYVVDGGEHRDIVTILIKREAKEDNCKSKSLKIA